MAKFEFTPAVAQAEEKILSDELYQAEREHIVGFLEQLRSATTATDFYQLQLGLLGRTKARQQLAGEIRDEVEALKGQISELVRQEPKPLEEIRAVQELLTLREHQRKVSEALRWNLLTIGDGMAWEALGYDRGGITILGQGDRVARFADDAGFKAEAEAIGALWDHGTFALHNDLTTCLRHGDVTAISPGPDAPERQIEIYEIKARRAPGSGAPQLVRLDQATRLLNEGRAEGDDGEMRSFHRAEFPYRTHLANLRDLLRKGRKDGYAAAKIGACAWIAVFFYPARRGQIEEMLREHHEAQERVGWPSGEKVSEWMFAGRRIETRRYSFAELAPVSIFPLDVEDVADLMMGFLDALVCLDGGCVEECFAKHEIVAEVATPPESGKIFLQATRAVGGQVVSLTVPAQLREQMLLELMTPENLVAHTVALTDVMVERGLTEEQHLIVPADQRSVWENYE